MPIDPKTTYIYHITDIRNLALILQAGGLFSDAKMRDASSQPTEIGFPGIKSRRLNEYRISCCRNRFVGEFVPFYFCPRSPMLFTINNGNTGHPRGCQQNILHLVSTVQQAYDLQKDWAISDGNAGASYTTFSNHANALAKVNWQVVKSNDWGRDKLHTKATEFLIADFFPIRSFIGIGCFNKQIADNVKSILEEHAISLQVKSRPDWYYQQHA